MPRDQLVSSCSNRKYGSAGPVQRRSSDERGFRKKTRESCHFVTSRNRRRDGYNVRTSSSLQLIPGHSSALRPVSHVSRDYDGWGQHAGCRGDDGENYRSKWERQQAAQRQAQLQCALEITVDCEHAARHKVLDEEAKAMTQWLRQAFTEFGTHLQRQVRRKDLEEQAKDEEQRSRNRA